MAKQNPMLAKIEEMYRRQYEEKLMQAHANYIFQLKMCLQQASDAALMAIDDVFDVNEYSAEKFHAAMVKYVNDISQLFIDDSETDPECVYSKADIDRRLIQIVGKDNFRDWDSRYGGADDAG